jgi:undecaprenyl diphosphate synthase
MDGNRRWAKKQGLSAIGGHNYVVDHVIEPLIERCGELGIQYLTVWAFSTENWKRDQDEVNGLMELFRRGVMEKLGALIKRGARLNFIGDLTKFSRDLQKGMHEAVEKSRNNTGITVTFALNYGGRDEIMRAVKRGGVDFEKYLDTAGMPDPDLLIRTGGEQRLSGFMPWQTVYTELYFTDVLMPEFGVEELNKALEEYERRQRRFGK